jgi:hypothetical protein
MRAPNGPTFDFAIFLPASSEDQGVARQRSVSMQCGRHKLIIGLYFVSAPVATIAWLAGLSWAAIKVIGYALS